MRHVWIACWLFLWANWIGQDYLSPQAFTFFEGLVVVGLVLRCSQRDWQPRHPTGVNVKRQGRILSKPLLLNSFAYT
jgi:hypothetical protein